MIRIMENSSFKAHITGMVQGVGFRHFAYKMAANFNITGYVKNLVDGRVEVFAEGSTSQLEAYLAELRKGPAFSRVEDVDVMWNEYQGKYDRFYIESMYRY